MRKKEKEKDRKRERKKERKRERKELTTKVVWREERIVYGHRWLHKNKFAFIFVLNVAIELKIGEARIFFLSFLSLAFLFLYI